MTRDGFALNDGFLRKVTTKRKLGFKYAPVKDETFQRKLY